MVEYKEGERQNVRGLKLFTVEYHPSKGQPKAALVFHHGLAEHIGRYKAVFTKLTEEGIAVYSQDMFGHGRSEGERALIQHFDELVDDFAGLADYACQDLVKRYGTAPPVHVFLGGHSMGGLVSALTALREQTRWAGLILLGPAIDVQLSLPLKIQAAVGNLLANVMPRARIVKAVRPEDMCADPACVQEYIDDPLVTIGPLACSTASQILKTFAKLRPHYGAFTLPIYAVHGDADKCTSFAATRRFLEEASSRDKTLNAVAGGYHEVILGPGTETTLAQLTDWILKHSTPAREP